MNKKWLWGLATLIVTACGSEDPSANPVSIPESNIVVRATAEMPISMGGQGRLFGRNATKKADVAIRITNPAIVSMSVDDSEIAVPEMNLNIEDFGWLEISDLRDNDLKACGPDGRTKCNRALIRMYTTGEAGAGFYNSEERYGVPILATLTAPLELGLSAAQAVVIQSLVIPDSKRVVRLEDFGAVPKYNIDGDFREAGAGSFSTTLVIEYALGLAN